MTLRTREHLAGHIVVWMARISQAQDFLAYLDPCLDARDRERAARFHFLEDRARFVLGRGLLRKCVGHYLQQPPETIELSYTDRDRPVLAHDETLQFSISHAHDLVAVALTADARIGIDLEYVKSTPDLPELAERILSAKDLQAFQALCGNEALAAFFRVWTRKEAYLKARGEGIAEALQQTSVSMGPEEISSLTDDRDNSASTDWRLVSLPVPEGYMGNIACDNANKRLQFCPVRVDKGEVVL